MNSVPEKIERYPRPGPVGGRLIREVISFLDALSVERPGRGPWILAVSAGPDSMAMAQLLIKYGRKLKSNAHHPWILAYVNHGWRPQAARREESMLRRFARRHHVPLCIYHSPEPPARRSLEDQARRIRFDFLDKLAQRIGAEWILTAHHSGDLAETVLWRLVTGSAQTHGAGIRPISGRFLRPLLRCGKSSLALFCKEEGIRFSRDSSNLDTRFQRVRMRKEIMLPLKKNFPKAEEALRDLGLRAWGFGPKDGTFLEGETDWGLLVALLRDQQLPMRANQWKELRKRWNGQVTQGGLDPLTSDDKTSQSGWIDLKGGFRIRWERTCQSAARN